MIIICTVLCYVYIYDILYVYITGKMSGYEIALRGNKIVTERVQQVAMEMAQQISIENPLSSDDETDNSVSSCEEDMLSDFIDFVDMDILRISQGVPSPTPSPAPKLVEDLSNPPSPRIWSRVIFGITDPISPIPSTSQVQSPPPPPPSPIPSTSQVQEYVKVLVCSPPPSSTSQVQDPSPPPSSPTLQVQNLSIPSPVNNADPPIEIMSFPPIPKRAQYAFDWIEGRLKRK